MSYVSRQWLESVDAPIVVLGLEPHANGAKHRGPAQCATGPHANGAATAWMSCGVSCNCACLYGYIHSHEADCVIAWPGKNLVYAKRFSSLYI